MASNNKVELGLGLKLLIALSTLISTIVATGVGAFISSYITQSQAATATRQADVRKLEDQAQAFDTAMRIFVADINKKRPADTAREAVSANIDQQYAFLQTLIPLPASVDQRQSVIEYRNSLSQVSKALRKSGDVNMTILLGRTVAHSVDARIAAVNALRSAVGLPVATPEPGDLQPVLDFGNH